MKPKGLCLIAVSASLCVQYAGAFHLPFAPNRPQTSSPPAWRRFTNSVIEAVWPHHNPRQHRPCHAQSPPPSPARSGDVVLRFNLTSSEDAARLHDASETLLLDIWGFSREWVDVRLSADIVPSLLGLLPPSLAQSYIPLLRERDLAQAIRDTYPSTRDSRRDDQDQAALHSGHTSPRRPFSPALGSPATAASTNVFFSDYQPLSVIEPWLRLMSSLFTTHVRQITIGLSDQGRPILGLRVGVHPTNRDEPSPPTRKTVLIVGGAHAREWISTSTVNYIAYALITGYGKWPTTTHLLEAFDFVLIPTLNPDGYVYTWETDRLWRKNRQATGVRFCPGIDLDHAFAFAWDPREAGSSSSSSDGGTLNPCSESYAGDTPGQATEARRLADWVRNETAHHGVEFVGFLDLHSYAQEILYPYAYSCSAVPPRHETLQELATGLRKAIRVSHGAEYAVMSACEGNVIPTGRLPRIEAAGGSALDYFSHEVAVRYAFQIKLRDRGSYGFLLPSEHIVPTGEEMLNAVLYFGGFLSDVYEEQAPTVQLKKPELDDDGSEDLVAGVREEDLASGGVQHGVSDDDAAVALDEDDEVEDETLVSWAGNLGPDDLQWDLRRRRRR